MSSSRWLFLIATVSLGVTGCNKTLDEEQCGKVVDKMVDLLSATETPSERVEKVKAEVKADRRSRANVKDTCIGKMTESQFKCVMASKTFDEAVACDKR